MAIRVFGGAVGIITFGFLLQGTSSLCAQTLRVDPELAKTIREVRAEDNGAEAMDFLTGVYRTDRWANFAKFQETAQYLQETMKAIGLSDVESLSAPADGVSQFGFWTMPLAWDVKQASLEIIEPAVPEEMRVLADYFAEPASLIMWSGSTPPGGITAEVVELKPSTLEQLKRMDVKKKMVLTEPSLDLAQRGALKAALYKQGAAGMLSYASENPDVTNGHYWMNAWGDYGWGFTKMSSPLVGFSLTPRQGAYLSNLLANDKKVRVKALADTRYYSGQYPYITAVVRGTDSKEEVLELGHAFELGAQDNSTGVAAMLEAVATLQRLINAGKLPRPNRSIRILVMSEDYGSSAYIATHMDRMKQTIGAICMDTPAGRYGETAGYSFALNPDVSRSYQDALIMHVAESYYAGLRQKFPRWTPYRPRSDSYLSDPTIGVPTVSATGSSGAVNVHHNSADTLDRVDQRSLRDLSSMVATFLYSLASAGDKEIPWLAEITADRSDENMIAAAAPFLARISMASTSDFLAQQLAGGFAQIDYNAGRDQEALLSVLRLASPKNQAMLRTELNPLLQHVRGFARKQCERLQAAVDRRSIELGSATPVKPSAPFLEASLAEASHIVIKRKRFGPVTLDDLPLEQREGYPGFGDNPAPLTLLYWCDGKRNLAEVIRLIELEQGPLNFDFVGYFKFLARHGYVELRRVTQ
ncbi:MAG TPA: M28 family peptidase [Bryobacteraceae bacterium]|nr:M28 family peptidase [Bryobacteraceae bacterium]